MRKMEKKKVESVNDLDFYRLNAMGADILWALAPYDSVILIVMKSDHMYVYFENLVSKALSTERLLEMSSLVGREVWRISTWGFSQNLISEEEMNSVLFRHCHPQLFFL